MKNASEHVADWLAAQGIEQVFAVTGGGAMFLNHAFASHAGLRCTYMHHEQACAMAAEGYFRISGKPAVVNVTTGPGGINALNGVFGAFTDSIPMIVLSGQVKRETALSHTPVPGLRQLGDQEAPIVDMARPITKGAWAVGSIKELGEVLPRAYALATTGRPGPVWIDIPIDLQASVSTFGFQSSPPRPKADRDRVGFQADEVLNLLRRAHRPVILAGSGVWIAGAETSLLSLAVAIGVPIATAWSHDLIPSDHPLFVGRPGTIGTRAGNLCLQAADLVLVLGSRLNVRQVSYNWGSFASRARIVQVDVDPAELCKPLVRPSMAVEADVADFVGALGDAIRKAAPLPSYADWIQWCHAIGDRFPPMEASCVSVGAINPYQAVKRVFEHLPERAVAACGNASACIVPFQIGFLKAGQRMFSNSGSASMGYDLPAAIGAAIADPSRRVVCIAGDGSLQLNVQELQSLKSLQLNVAIVVLANDGYLSIRLSHQNFFGRVVGADRSSGVTCPDYVAVARAYGIEAFHIVAESELDLLKQALAAEGPVLIQIQVDPEQGFTPKLKSRMDETGKFLTPELDDLFPFLPPQELAAIRSEASRIHARPAVSPHDQVTSI